MLKLFLKSYLKYMKKYGIEFHIFSFYVRAGLCFSPGLFSSSPNSFPRNTGQVSPMEKGSRKPSPEKYGKKLPGEMPIAMGWSEGITDYPLNSQMININP